MKRLFNKLAGIAGSVAFIWGLDAIHHGLPFVVGGLSLAILCAAKEDES